MTIAETVLSLRRVRLGCGPAPDRRQVTAEEHEDVDDANDRSTVRAELRFEIGFLHDRVNALLTAEAFLTIAYTAAMSNGASWGPAFAAVVGPVLAVLGLVLALLAWPGVTATARLVLDLTKDQGALLTQQVDDPAATPPGSRRSAFAAVQANQRKSLLFFRAVPAIFAVVWIALALVAVYLTW